MKKHMLVSVDRGETRVALLEDEDAASEPTAGEAGTTTDGGEGGANATAEPASGRRRGGRGGGGGKGPAGSHDVGRVAELYLERRSNRSIVGNVYKGRVDKVLPGLEAAFVDIGLEKNAFLHVDEIVLPGVKVERRGRGRDSGPKIGDLIKGGDEIVCQVTKDPLKTKGARVSMDLTIAGRYLVYTPSGEGVGVSKKIEDTERNRLRREVKGLELEGGGAIVRTAAQGATRPDFERELPYLFKLHEVMHGRAEQMTAPALVFQEADLPVRVVRDIFSKDFAKAIVDDEHQHQRLCSFFQRTAPELVDKVELWTEKRQLFDAYGVEPVIEGLLSKRVDLPSGGYLLIDTAEALTVIDVNSGSFVGRGKQARLEDTITRTNLEAAEAVVNQLRLRDIGGIIVIDFIDMAKVRNQREVLKVLKSKLGEDRTKTFTAEISKLGLVEMTRQNVTEGAREVITRACPTCDGEGVVESEETLAIRFERVLRAHAETADPKHEAFLVRMHPDVVVEFTGMGARVLHELEAHTGRYFVFEGSERFDLDEMEIVMEGTREAVREKAIPFSEGEEALVQIVEPHMYNVDDAVAKIGGYVVTVTGGGRYVGERRMVRIERAGRTSATAALVDTSPPANGGRAAPDAGDDGPGPGAGADDGDGDGSDAVPSRGRRRGRRGGRRRSPSTRDDDDRADSADTDTDEDSEIPDDAPERETADSASSSTD